MKRENPSACESRRLNREFAEALAAALPLPDYPPHPVAAGQTLLHDGDRPAALPLVESGRLQVLVHLGDEGRRVVPVSFDAGEIAMCSQLFSREPINVDIVAAQQGVVRWLPRAAIEAAVSERIEVMRPLIRFLAQRLREVQMREKLWMTRGVRARVWAVLLREIDHDEPAAADAMHHIVLTHEQLAERAGVSRPKLSQALKGLEREGLVQLGRGDVAVRAR
ncbi:MAG: Crp/Fnr family transcriptional regulator [Burkholderiales bacterium]|nr:Crp/Fnr family transcriptional regulator [Burkholderiales bacterium]